jgi:O-acetyl-ADP-ribose deacetylase (regulator of RNase III)
MKDSLHFAVGPAVIELVRGNIVDQQVDAIVNAANAQLAGGGGVDGAIHRAAGKDQLQAELRRYQGCPTGSAVLTPGLKLPARYIIHAVGPVFCGGTHGEPELLRSAYRSSLEIAAREGFVSVASPSISTGVYGYPFDLAAPIAVRTAREHLLGETSVRLVRFVLFDREAFSAFAAAGRGM